MSQIISDLPAQEVSDLQELFKFEEENGSSDFLGHSLLNSEGKFFWCDSTSQKYFELKKCQKWKRASFFDLLIPFSKYTLEKKFARFNFDSEIFMTHHPHKMNFTYVVYSKKNRDKYYRHLTGKMKGRKVPEDTNESQEKELYYKYLQALSSEI